MRIICILFVFFIGLLLSGCATSTDKATNSKKSSNLSENTLKKNPITVALYTGEKKPEKPYIILGKETISKYNQVGIKRQEAKIRDVMRHDAARLGGDAVINISHDKHTVTGTVIAFQTEQKDISEKA